MRTVTRLPLSGRYLSFAQREEIAILNAQGEGVREIARRLSRSPSTISRELRRNAATRGGKLEYRARTAQWHADLRARRPKTAKLAAIDKLRDYVQDRLAGVIAAPNGTPVPGPTVRWIGRRHGRRKDRRWSKAWSPEQISNRLRVDFPDDESMRISHEAIYQALFVQGRGALKRELVACLRTGRALRVPRSRAKQRQDGFVAPEVMISARPAEIEDRAVPGHWEGDLIIGLNKSAIGTLVERSTRFTMAPAPSSGRGLWDPAEGQERSGLGRLRRRGRPRCHRLNDHDPARRAPSFPHLGPGQGDGQARRPEDRGRSCRLLLRPAEPLAARDEREHQRPAAPVLPEGHRPQQAHRRRPRRRRGCAQRAASQNARLADSR
jgi:hypothetical protein